MLSLPVLLTLVAALALLTPVIRWHRAFVQGMLFSWARDNGFEVISWEWRPLLRGPFMRETLNAFDHTEVFRVIVRDKAGHEHEGWVCCYLPLFMLPYDRTAQRVNASLQAVVQA